MRLLTTTLLTLVAMTLAISYARSTGSSQVDLVADSFSAILSRDMQLANGTWCWRGICPDKLTIPKAAGLVSDMGLTFDYRLSEPQSFTFQYPVGAGDSLTGYVNAFYVNVTTLTLEASTMDASKKLLLGDATILLGMPISLSNDGKEICFIGSICAYVAESSRRLTPFGELDQIHLIAPSALVKWKSVRSNIPFRAWAGFVKLPLK